MINQIDAGDTSFESLRNYVVSTLGGISFVPLTVAGHQYRLAYEHVTSPDGKLALERAFDFLFEETLKVRATGTKRA